MKLFRYYKPSWSAYSRDSGAARGLGGWNPRAVVGVVDEYGNLAGAGGVRVLGAVKAFHREGDAAPLLSAGEGGLKRKAGGGRGWGGPLISGDRW